MKRSISAFVLGLIGSIFCLYQGFGVALFGDIANSITGEGVATIFVLLGWVCFLGAILGIVGASLCFKKARVGGVLLLISTLMCGALTGYALISILSVSADGLAVSSLMMQIIPVILILIATILAFCAKLRVVKNINPNQFNNFGNQGYQQDYYNQQNGENHQYNNYQQQNNNQPYQNERPPFRPRPYNPQPRQNNENKNNDGNG